jgi:hypothetical protein
MVLPQFLDRYLAKNAYQAQETAAAVSPMRKDNPMAPVSELHRTHGSFNAEAANRVLALPGPAARLIAVALTALTRRRDRLRRGRPVAASAAVAAQRLSLTVPGMTQAKTHSSALREMKRVAHITSEYSYLKLIPRDFCYVRLCVPGACVSVAAGGAYVGRKTPQRERDSVTANVELSGAFRDAQSS